MSIAKQKIKIARVATMPFEFPERPKFPMLKTIGGVEDRFKLDAYRAADEQWYGDFKSSVKSKVDELTGSLEDALTRIAALEGK